MCSINHLSLARILTTSRQHLGVDTLWSSRTEYETSSQAGSFSIFSLNENQTNFVPKGLHCYCILLQPSYSNSFSTNLVRQLL